MRQMQYEPGNSEATKIGIYKDIFEKAASKTMQSNSVQKLVFKKSKRFRSAFTTEQINYLENQYQKFPYINREHRKEVAAFLNLEERPIKIWFQNRRMKEKKESYKECDYETSPNKPEFSKDQLRNMPAVPSSNDQRSYSLPILSLRGNAPIISNIDSKSNINKEQKVIPTSVQKKNKKPNVVPKRTLSKANYYKEAQDGEHLSPYFCRQSSNNTTLPITINEKNQTSFERNTAEFSINLCKKYKLGFAAKDTVSNGPTSNEVLKKTNKIESKPNKTNNSNNTPEDFSAKKPKPSNYPPQPEAPKQIHVNNSAYYPVIPTIYTPPFVSSGGVLWKPVNVMPVMATNTPYATTPSPQGRSGHEQSKNCLCNCHGASHHVPVNFPQCSQNPYAQYVITVPYPQTSPKF